MMAESARLRERGTATWTAAVAHPMVTEIGHGTLPHATFLFYFEQNLRYLHDYARAIALAVVSAIDRDAQSTLARFLGQITGVEIPANVAFLQRLGGTPDRLPEPLPTTGHYAAHLLEVAGEGNLAVTLAALLPCQWSYGEIGRRLAAHIPDDQIYADWIGMFAGEDYDDLVGASTELLDRVFADQDRRASGQAFDRSTHFELDFWEMAYTRGGSAVRRPVERHRAAPALGRTDAE